jgi:hypothetical protein
MITEVIWTSAASQDYLEATALPPTKSMDAVIELLKLFPDMGLGCLALPTRWKGPSWPSPSIWPLLFLHQ